MNDGAFEKYGIDAIPQSNIEIFGKVFPCESIFKYDNMLLIDFKSAFSAETLRDIHRHVWEVYDEFWSIRDKFKHNDLYWVSIEKRNGQYEITGIDNMPGKYRGMWFRLQ